MELKHVMACTDMYHQAKGYLQRCFWELQVFRDVPTEEELFADDDAGPATPLMRRGTNLPEGDEGFGATLRSLFSSNAPSERHSRQAPLTETARCTSPALHLACSGAAVVFTSAGKKLSV